MKKVLTIDDSGIIRKIIRGTVEMLDYGFLEAVHGEAGLDVLTENYEDVALVLLDWNMPVMDGLTTLKCIKSDERFSNIPVMMVTTESESARIEEAMAVGANGYMPKPFSQEDLMTKIMDMVPAN